MSDDRAARIRAAAQEGGGFKAHPFGTFEGHVENIEERAHEGATIFEFSLRTDKGVARYGLWKVTEEDIEGRLLERAGGDPVKAEDDYVNGIAKTCRLYRDLGLADPSLEPGTSEEIEGRVWDRLGEMLGQPCEVVVKEPMRGTRPVVWINASKGAGAGKPVAKKAQQELKTAFAPAQSLDQIPF